jgi:hypothetical protein
MAEPGCTRSKAEACLLADEALATLMKPVDDCRVRRIVESRDHNTRLDEALAGMILGCTIMEIRELKAFKAGHATGSDTPLSVEEEVIYSDGNASCLQQIFESTTLDFCPDASP